MLASHHSAPQPAKRLVAFDGLRGVCALMVLFHHLLLTQPVFVDFEWHRPQAAAFGWGEWLLLRTPLHLLWAGQARALLFFVLSGYVLSLPWLDGRAAPYGRYLLGRLCRIYPPYAIAMAMAAAGSFLLGGHKIPAASVYFNELGWAFQPAWAAFPSIAAVLNNHASEYMNEAVWSLVWEVRVAFIFPLLILPAVRWRNTGIAATLMALFVSTYIARHLFSQRLELLLNAPENIFYFAQYFLFGIAISLNRARISQWGRRWKGWLGVGAVTMGCLICWLPWPVQHDRLVGVGAAIILAGILGSDRVQGWLTNKPLLWLGRQSYSLYLIHVPLLMVVVIAFGGAVPLVAFCAVVPAIILCAELFRRWVEMPSVALAQRLTGYARPVHRAHQATGGRHAQIESGGGDALSRI
ncbi:MAG TPA: acyltransferase [Acetobacteraceae bacterium]